MPETPFLYYVDGQGNDGVGSYYDGEHNGAGEPSVSIHSNYLPNFLPPEAVAAEKKSAAGPRQMSVDALRQMLGQLDTDEDGRAAYHPKYAAGEMDDYFEAKRRRCTPARRASPRHRPACPMGGSRSCRRRSRARCTSCTRRAARRSGSGRRAPSSSRSTSRALRHSGRSIEF